LGLIGMGKCGGRELNYVSDVDVIFVAEAPPAVEDESGSAAHRDHAGHGHDEGLFGRPPRRAPSGR